MTDIAGLLLHVDHVRLYELQDRMSNRIDNAGRSSYRGALHGAPATPDAVRQRPPIRSNERVANRMQGRLKSHAVAVADEDREPCPVLVWRGK
jgi:hypothetical protein